MPTTTPEDGQCVRPLAVGVGAGPRADGGDGRSRNSAGTLGNGEGSLSACTEPGGYDALGVTAGADSGSPSPAGTRNPAHPESDSPRAPS
ncbi:hypothetical protein [Streptomyces sp. NPDC014622]|uniref:hypothetical protein n=1 Tax=Streptomyces sp. NPDC014622 TaxID=3364874 RepID=UPI0036F4BC11